MRLPFFCFCLKNPKQECGNTFWRSLTLFCVFSRFCALTRTFLYFEPPR